MYWTLWSNFGSSMLLLALMAPVLNNQSSLISWLTLLWRESQCHIILFPFGCFSTIDNPAKHPHQSFQIVLCTLYGVEVIKFYTLVILFVPIMLPQITELFTPQKELSHAFEIFNSSILWLFRATHLTFPNLNLKNNLSRSNKESFLPLWAKDAP